MVQRKHRSLEHVLSKFTTDPGPSHAMLMLDQMGTLARGGRDGCCVDDACIRKWNSVELSATDLMLGGNTVI